MAATLTSGSGSGIDMAVLAASARGVMDHIGSLRPRCAAILGSGWGAVTQASEVVDTIPYTAIPCLGAPGVKGHAGELRLCRSGGETSLIFNGRRHWYEGQGWTPVAFPVYLAIVAGARSILLTNAAGAINSGMHPGDLMIIRDHINMMGGNPLIGNQHAAWGERFPDQSRIYPVDLQDMLADAARDHGIAVHRGVYLATSGPVYETPAEIQAYAMMGADAIGMSTVPEAILANASGLRTAALSCIANPAAGMGGKTPLHHDGVLDVTRARMSSMADFVPDVLGRMSRM